MKKQILFLLVLVFLLNFFWEIAHMPLYEKPNYLSNTEFSIIHIKASFIDLFFICLIFITLYIKNRNKKWLNKPSKLDYFIIIISGLIISYIVEHQALLQNKWSYTPLMPLILGVGLTPLIQLSSIAIFSLWLITRHN